MNVVEYVWKFGHICLCESQMFAEFSYGRQNGDVNWFLIFVLWGELVSCENLMQFSEGGHVFAGDVWGLAQLDLVEKLGDFEAFFSISRILAMQVDIAVRHFLYLLFVGSVGGRGITHFDGLGRWLRIL